jgi:hypothetical protein
MIGASSIRVPRWTMKTPVVNSSNRFSENERHDADCSHFAAFLLVNNVLAVPSRNGIA